MINVVNQVAFLRSTREFPEELHQVTIELDRAYVDIANAVNNRIIGIFPINRPAITGESWFIRNNLRQTSLRQVYNFTTGIVTGSTINIGFKISKIAQFSPKCYGTFTDGTNWYGLIFGSNIPIAGQVSFFLQVNAGSTTSDQIVFEVGAGAPTITSGLILLEWISDTINLAIN